MIHRMKDLSPNTLGAYLEMALHQFNQNQIHFMTMALALAVSLAYLIVPIYSRVRALWTGQDDSLDQNERLGVSILIPAYNEAPVIIDSVRSMLALDHEELEIIVVNDASSDETLDVLKNAFHLTEDDHRSPREVYSHTQIHQIYRSSHESRLTVIDKAKSGKGKADALNVGLGFASHEWICTVDADSILEPKAIKKMVKRIKADKQVISVSGCIRPGNFSRPKQLIEYRPSWIKSPLIINQLIEYHSTFQILKLVQSYIRGIYCVSGAFGMFKKESLSAVNGYRSQSATEDIDLTLRLHMYHRERQIPYKIIHAPEATCWTEVPFTWQQFFRQRVRWNAGGLQALLSSRRGLLNPRYGTTGLIVLPSLMFSCLGPLMGPLGLMIAIKSLSAYPLLFTLGIYAFFQGLSILKSVVACGLTESFQGQRTYGQHLFAIIVSFFTLPVYALVHFATEVTSWLQVFGNRGSIQWGEMKRAGFGTPLSTFEGSQISHSSLAKSIPLRASNEVSS